MTPLPSVLTLTGNLLAEHTLEFAAWAPGRTQRATRASFQVGGKGINVAKMLRRLGVPTSALCFTGGASGAECERWLRTQDFDFTAFATDAATRQGFVVRAPAIAETTFLGLDAAPSAAAVAACAAHLDRQPDGAILAICGSLPGWGEAAFDPLRAALERWMQRGALVVDTYGPPLAWFADRPAALVKINATELASLPSASDRPAATLAAAQRTRPVLRWVVSDGPGDVWFCDRDHEPARLSPPSVTEVSATGSGDVQLACLIQGLFRARLPLDRAVAAALPYGAANAAHPGIAEFALDGLPPLSDTVGP